MEPSKQYHFVPALVCGMLLCAPFSLNAQTFNWHNYDKVLQQHIQAGSKDGIDSNLLNYPALLNHQPFHQISERLAQFNPKSLTDREQLAFYINAYNYFTIKLILDNWPVEDITQLGTWYNSVWEHKVGKIAGQAVTLDQIEHKILRKFKEPRIHFAIACASLSCPDLRREAYNADNLEQQLNEQATRFINSRKGVQIIKGELYISKIFAWFDEDFKRHNGVIPFLQLYNPQYGQFSDFSTLDYNWKLNYLAATFKTP